MSIFFKKICGSKNLWLIAVLLWPFLLWSLQPVTRCWVKIVHSKFTVKMPKRKYVFRDILKSDFPFIRETNSSEEMEWCDLPLCDLILYIGCSDINYDINKKKHKGAPSASIWWRHSSKNVYVGTLRLQSCRGRHFSLSFCYSWSLFPLHGLCSCFIVVKLFKRPKFSCARREDDVKQSQMCCLSIPWNNLQSR